MWIFDYESIHLQLEENICLDESRNQHLLPSNRNAITGLVLLTDVQENTATIIKFGGAVSGFAQRHEASHQSERKKRNVDHFVGR